MGAPVPHPAFVIAPSETPSFAAHYTISEVDGSLEFEEFGSFAGWLVCEVDWTTGDVLSIPYQTYHLGFGLSLDAGFAVHEDVLNGVLTHREWWCEGTVAVEVAPDCRTDMLAHDVSAATPPATTRSLDDGWQNVSAPQSGLADGNPQEATVALDLRVLKLRADHATTGVPLTGRVTFSTVDSIHGTLLSGDYLTGRCLEDKVFATGTYLGPVREFEPATTGEAKLGVFETSGDPPSRFVPFPPSGPAGTWTSWVQACNAACGGPA